MIDIDREQLGELLSAYLDGELDERQRAFAERLLESDDEVRALYDSLRRTVESVQSLPHHEAPPALAEDMREQLERRALLTDGDTDTRLERLRFPWLGLLSAAAVVLAATLVGINQLGTWSDTGSPNERLASAAKSDLDRSGVLLEEKDSALETIGRTARVPESLEAKLDAGADLESIRKHAFAGESVVLTVALGDRRGLDPAVRRLSTYMTDSEIVDVASTDHDPSTIKSRPFFVAGRAGINYRDLGERQMLVRIPVAALGDLVDQVALDPSTTERVTLAAGSLTFDGRDNVRTTLDRLNPAHAAPSTRRQEMNHGKRRRSVRAVPPGDGKNRNAEDANAVADVADVFKALGIAPEVLTDATQSKGGESAAVVSAEPLESESTGTLAVDEHGAAAKPESRRNEGVTTAKKEHAFARRDVAQASRAGDDANQQSPKATQFVTIVVKFTGPKPESHKPGPLPAKSKAPPSGSTPKQSPKSR